MTQENPLEDPEFELGIIKENGGGTSLAGLLATVGRGERAPIDMQVGAQYDVQRCLLALIHAAEPSEDLTRGSIEQIAPFLAIGIRDIARLLRRWADICEKRPDMYRRPEWSQPLPDMAGLVPAEVLDGLRRASPDEAQRLATFDAQVFRSMADACQAAFEACRGRVKIGMYRDPDEPVRVPTSLYRWFDVDDVLLYVGITGSLASRQDAHGRRSSWSEFAVRSTVGRYRSRRAAESAEKRAIRTERPLFNRVHNDTPEARQRLVDYLIAHGRTDLLAPAVSRG